MLLGKWSCGKLIYLIIMHNSHVVWQNSSVTYYICRYERFTTVGDLRSVARLGFVFFFVLLRWDDADDVAVQKLLLLTHFLLAHDIFSACSSHTLFVAIVFYLFFPSFPACVCVYESLRCCLSRLFASLMKQYVNELCRRRKNWNAKAEKPRIVVEWVLMLTNRWILEDTIDELFWQKYY